MGNARVLYRLQQIDAETESTRKLIAELRAKLGESVELLDAAARLSEAERQFERVQSTQKEREIELQAVTTKLAVDQGKLYDGKMGNPKELKNLQDEVESLMRRRDILQDAVLESMIEVEAARQAAESARANRAEVESRWSGDQTAAARQLEAANTHAAQLTHARAEVEGRLSAKEIEIYVELRRRKGPAPVARVRNGNCGRCGVALPVTVARQARTSDDLVYCPSCGRLLVNE